MVLAIGNEQFKMYINGVDLCPSWRPGRPRRSNACGANFGLPNPNHRRPWTQTSCDGDVNDTCKPRDGATELDCVFTSGNPSSCDQSMCIYSRNCNAALSRGKTTGMVMRTDQCRVCEDVEAGSEMNPFGEYSCAQVVPWLLDVETAAQHPWFVSTNYTNPLQSLCEMPLTTSATFSTVCPVTCEVCAQGSSLVPGCDETNSTSPGEQLLRP